MNKSFFLIFLITPLYAGTHMQQGDSAGGDLTGTFPNPTINPTAISASGPTRAIQSSNGGSFYGDSGLTYSSTTVRVAINHIKEDIFSLGLLSIKAGSGNVYEDFFNGDFTGTTPYYNRYGLEAFGSFSAVGFYGFLNGNTNHGGRIEHNGFLWTDSSQNTLMSFDNKSSNNGEGCQLHIGTTTHASNVRNGSARVNVYGNILVGENYNDGLTTAPSNGIEIQGQAIFNDAIQPYARTKAQLFSLSPSATGLIYYCSDCTVDGIVVSTGTNAGGFGRISARTTQIQ